MQAPVSVVIRSLAFRWDRENSLLWLDIGTEAGGQWSVGFPVAYIAAEIQHQLTLLGVQAQPEIGEDLGSVDGLGGWLKRTSKRASRAVKHATKTVVRKATRTATKAIKTAYEKRVPKFARQAISRYGATALEAAGTGASFVPGLGTGVAAGLGTAAALARGRSLAQAARAGAMSSLPGGALTRAALEAGIGVASGQRVDRALLAGARQAVPGGAAGQAAFDTALAVARGKRPDRAVLANAARLAGRYVDPRMQQAAGTVLAATRGRRLDRAMVTAATQIAQGAVTRKADRFFGAIGGEGLAAMAAANKIADMTDQAANAAERLRAGVGDRSDALLVAKAKQVARNVRGLSRNPTPAARLALASLRAQPAPGAPRVRSVARVSGPLDGLNFATAAARRRRW